MVTTLAKQEPCVLFIPSNGSRHTGEESTGEGVDCVVLSHERVKIGSETNKQQRKNQTESVNEFEMAVVWQFSLGFFTRIILCLAARHSAVL